MSNSENINRVCEARKSFSRLNDLLGEFVPNSRRTDEAGNDVHKVLAALNELQELHSKQDTSNKVTMDAKSLREAVYWANPDNDPEQEETEVVLLWLPKREGEEGVMAAGYYLYYIDCPEEGVIGPLGEDLTPEDALLKPLEKTDGACMWGPHSDGSWKGGCGIVWHFNDDGPAENGVNYCPRCGRSLVLAPEEKGDE